MAFCGFFRVIARSDFGDRRVPILVIAMLRNPQPWHMLDANHTVVFANKANLATAPLANIVYDEHGQGPEDLGGYLVWTGTDTGGMWSGSSCDSWLGNGAGETGTSGETVETTSWTHSTYHPTQTCDSLLHLYCFEQ